jgi:uncharacterized membrane protein YfcA
MEFVADAPTLLLLFGAALLAGFVDAIAGGGGLITLPALLLAGVSPVAAIGTNKSQSVFGSGVASATVIRKKIVSIDEVRAPFVRAVFGGAVGAFIVQRVDAEALDVVIPIVVAGIGSYFLFAPRVGDVATEPRIRASIYRNTVVPIIGFYDGFFGPGTGSFFAMGGVALRGLGVIKATATAKTLNFGSNVAALAIFVIGGQVVWAATAAMIAGQLAGATVGARTMIRGGTRLIRPLVVTVSVAMLVKWFVG